jgi:hypothetical protein
VIEGLCRHAARHGTHSNGESAVAEQDAEHRAEWSSTIRDSEEAGILFSGKHTVHAGGEVTGRNGFNDRYLTARQPQDRDAIEAGVRRTGSYPCDLSEGGA